MNDNSVKRESFRMQDYELFRQFLERACGILLGENKQYLVLSRLKNIMRDNSLSCLSELVKLMENSSVAGLRKSVIEAMTTNETLWFRDVHPFNILREQLLPDFIKKQNRRSLRIWSAACSSGQEPYSISMTVEEYRNVHAGVLPCDVRIVATDLSRSILQFASTAEYDDLALSRGLSLERLKNFFMATTDSKHQLKQFVRDRVEFRELNLLDNYSTLGKFDIVFCRNVLIYFSTELKNDILNRIHSSLNPGGYLFLGSSEGISSMSKYYEMVQCHPGIIYRAK